MKKVTRTISISEDIDQILQNISTNFFNANYSLSLENIIRAADSNNIIISNGGLSDNIKTLKRSPILINTIDLKSVPYNGNDKVFKSNCSDNFSIPFQTALFKMIFLISQYSYKKYQIFNVHNKHYIGFKENTSMYQINSDGNLNHGVYINSLKTLGLAGKSIKDYIITNYYPIKKDRSFVFVSLPELYKTNDKETVFISHLERFTRSNNHFADNKLWNHIKFALGLSDNSKIEFLSHVEEYLLKENSNKFDFTNKKIEALELSIENIYTIINYFDELI